MLVIVGPFGIHASFCMLFMAHQAEWYLNPSGVLVKFLLSTPMQKLLQSSLQLLVNYGIVNHEPVPEVREVGIVFLVIFSWENDNDNKIRIDWR